MRTDSSINFKYKIFIVALLTVFGILFFSFASVEAADYYQVDPGPPVEIDEHGECRMVTNNGSLAIFVPTKTPNEWAEFRIHCPDTPNCPNITMSDCLPGTYDLTIIVNRDSTQMVVINPGPQFCWDNCAFSYSSDTEVTLTPEGLDCTWSGDCSGTADNEKCFLTMDEDKFVVADFETPPAPPLCDCTSWSDNVCSGGSCFPTQMEQTRSCDPADCDYESQCLDDACNPWANGSCGGSCPSNQREQTRSCTYGCESTSRCIDDPSCAIPDLVADGPHLQDYNNGRASAMIGNTGNIAVNDSTAYLKIGPSGANLEDLVHVDSVNTGHIGEPGSGSEWNTIVFPNWVCIPGQMYTLRVFADGPNSIIESNENNNSSGTERSCPDSGSCFDECSSGQVVCCDDSSRKTCGNYDADSCLEWSSCSSCGTDQCIGTTWRDHYCSGGSCGSTDYSNDPKCTVACDCGSWSNVGCGGSCLATQMRQTRSCNPSGCDDETRCLEDACGAWTDQSCGGSCSSDQREQTRSCTYGCQSTSRCVADASCVHPLDALPDCPFSGGTPGDIWVTNCSNYCDVTSSSDWDNRCKFGTSYCEKCRQWPFPLIGDKDCVKVYNNGSEIVPYHVFFGLTSSSIAHFCIVPGGTPNLNFLPTCSFGGTSGDIWIRPDRCTWDYKVKWDGSSTSRSTNCNGDEFGLTAQGNQIYSYHNTAFGIGTNSTVFCIIP